MSFSALSYFINLAIIEALLFGVAVFVKPPARRWLMVLAALAALFYITPRLILIYLAFWLIVAVLVSCQNAASNLYLRRAVLVIGVVGGVATLLLFKLFPFDFWLVWNRDTHNLLIAIFPSLENLDRMRPIITAIGLSFAVFRAIDLLIKVHITKLRDVSFLSVIQYGFFAPVLVSGPIIEYEEIQKPDPVTPQIVATAAVIFSLGILKVAFATFVLRGFADISALDAQTPLWRWIILLVHPWYFYLNFAGYSDLAIGLAGLFGFKLKPNFNNPFLRLSVQDFWANWHMSLTRWAQRNIFVPLGGYRADRQYIALVFTMLAIAFWHDISFSLLIFGLYHSAALVGQRLFLARGWRLPLPDNWSGNAIRLVATYLFVTLSFPLLELPLARLPSIYQSLIGL